MFPVSPIWFQDSILKMTNAIPAYELWYDMIENKLFHDIFMSFFLLTGSRHHHGQLVLWKRNKIDLELKSYLHQSDGLW